MGLIYIIRHGETEWNRKNLCMGQLDIPLNEHGRRQAEKLAERLSKIKFDALYSSDLSRAAETAQIIGEKIKLDLIQLSELREIFLGEYQSLSTEEVRAKFPSAYLVPSGKAAQARELAFPEIETRTKLYYRAIGILDQLVEKHRNQTIALVAHGGLIRCFTSYVLGKASNCSDQLFYSLAMDCSNCSITLVRIEPDGALKLPLINDTSHLNSLYDQSVDQRDFG